MIKKDTNGKDIVPVQVKDLMDHLLFDGRNIYSENSVLFGWEGSSFEFCGEFEGEISMDVEIKNNFYVDVTHRILFYVEVDGVPTKIGPYTDEPKNIVLCNVEKGFHRIKVIKNTAPIFNKYTLFSLRYNGVMGEKPADKKLHFEFIGDSITAGSCIMSNEGEVQDLDLDTSADAYYNYPAIVARNFDASYNDTAIHGIGIVNREGIFMTCAPTIYDYVNYYEDKKLKYDFNANHADVVVIALGTNDFRYNESTSEYYQICKEFLTSVRERHPDSFIYWIYGMMFTTFDETIRSLIENENDGKMKYIKMPSDMTGGYDHPSKKGQAEFARILTEDIKNTLHF